MENIYEQHNINQTYLQCWILSTCTVFTIQELNLLNKGLKCSPYAKNRKDLELLAVNAEIAINNCIETDWATIEKIQCAKIIKDSKMNVRTTEFSWSTIN